ncbi:MAG TPA: M3 family metallopeptidase [Kofleriaceae bacterium]|nr:M3 family metallopeptidase [Kofleriaceae bacterium]
MTKLSLIAVLVLSAVTSCKRPGKGSYFATVGPTGPTHPVPKPAVVETPSDVTWLEQCRGPIDTAKTQIAQILAVQGVRNATNTLDVYNEASRQLNNAGEWAHLHAAVNPDAKIRDAGRVCEQDVQKFVSNLMLDNRVYTAIKSVDVSLADANTKRFVTVTLRDFKRAGVELDDTGRTRIKQIDEEETRLGQQFQKNVDEDVRKVEIKDASQLAGLPPDWVAAHKPDASGVIRVSTDYPDYIPFMTYAESDELRKQLYIAFRSRGDAKNEELMQKILTLRAEKAMLLGFKDWSDYQSDDKMLKGGKAAGEFLDRVNTVALRRVKKDYAELLAQLKKKVPAATQVDDWQRMYLENQLRKDKYAVDSTEIRKYFPYEQTLKGLLDITSALYDITYVPVEKDPRVWAPDVAVYDVMQKGQKLGRIFLDMHPRTGKYKHAAQYPIVDGVKGVQLPEGALICNFADPATTKPALMEHADVVTMFHEFGHLMHHILGGQQHWIRQSGVATEWDFVEAPSQMFEEWAWNYDVLSRFAKHAETGAVIPKELVEKMRKADRFGKGLWATQQLFYAALSLKFHQETPAKLNQLELLKTLQKKYTPFAYVEGTKFHTSFAHLVGYSSMYYTYLWSLVIAKDLQSAFEKKGLLSTDVSYAYRDKILAAGGTKDAADLVKDFLGRPYNFKAFEKYLSEQ